MGARVVVVVALVVVVGARVVVVVGARVVVVVGARVVLLQTIKFLMLHESSRHEPGLLANFALFMAMQYSFPLALFGSVRLVLFAVRRML